MINIWANSHLQLPLCCLHCCPRWPLLLFPVSPLLDSPSWTTYGGTMVLRLFATLWLWGCLYPPYPPHCSSHSQLCHTSLATHTPFPSPSVLVRYLTSQPHAVMFPSPAHLHFLCASLVTQTLLCILPWPIWTWTAPATHAPLQVDSSHLPVFWPAYKPPGNYKFLPASPLIFVVASQQEGVQKSQFNDPQWFI